jgi:ligand-binding SRPBCC domain-containing protein
MSTYSIQTTQKIPAGIDTVWNFFSDPNNLSKITPPKMAFKVLSTIEGSQMYAGQIIEYKVKPIAHLPVYWMTEITQVEEGKYFIDEQRFGPYNFWHHQHHFNVIPGGVEMIDVIHYRNPFGILGNIANTLFVQKQLKHIFEYRFIQTEILFGKWSTAQANIVSFGR